MPRGTLDATAGDRTRLSRQRQTNTAPELALRRELHRRGLRYRVNYPIPVPRRRADIVFPRARVAVFVDGCFWHSCPTHGTTPTNNRDWWMQKLANNVARDRHTDASLVAQGWMPLRAWEHDDPVVTADRVAVVISRKQST